MEHMQGGPDIGQIVKNVDVEGAIKIEDDGCEDREAERGHPNRPQPCRASPEQFGFKVSQRGYGR